MFPLLEREGENTAELFQLWLNLPAKHKMVEPAFTMMWAADIPKVTLRDDAGRETLVTVNAGSLEGRDAPTPPLNSWASMPGADVAIWTLEMQPGATVTLPPASEQAHRMIYFHRGQRIAVGQGTLDVDHGALVQPDAPLQLENKGDTVAEILMLQGKPIGEPVAQHGPFVMNTRAEIEQAFSGYRRTQFGGWPWKADGPVHPREQGRFAVHPDGRREEAPVG